MKPNALFQQAVRTYVSSGKMPPRLATSLRKNFDGFAALGKVPLVPSQKAAEMWSEGISSHLEEQAAAGCSASREFLEVLKKFKSDPKNTGLLIEGVPTAGKKDAYFANHLTAAFADAFSFKHFSEGPVVSPRLIDSDEDSGHVSPHVDQPLSFPQIALFSLTCLTSKSEAQTFVIEADAIYERLSNKAREVFEKERFACVTTRQDQSLKIFDRDKVGELHVDFDFDTSDLVCRNVSGFSRDEIRDAFTELTEVAKDLYLKGEVGKVKITEGTMFFGKNHRGLHGRESLMSGIAAQRVLSRMYFEEKPRADEIETEGSKVEKMVKKSAAKEVLM